MSLLLPNLSKESKLGTERKPGSEPEWTTKTSHVIGYGKGVTDVENSTTSKDDNLFKESDDDSDAPIGTQEDISLADQSPLKNPDKPPETPKASKVKNPYLLQILSGKPSVESQKLIAEQSEEAGLSKEVLELFLGEDSFDIAKAIPKMKNLFKEFWQAKKDKNVGLQLRILFQYVKNQES